MASWRLKVFCTLWWMLIGVFITQSWMSFLVCSFLSLILSSFRHHHVFSKVRKHSVLVFFKKGPKCCTLHMKALSHRYEALPEREWMTEKKKKRETDTLGTSRFIPQSSIGGGKGGSDFLLFFFLTVIVPLNKCHIVWPAQGNRQHPAAPLPSANKSDRWPASVAAEGSPRWPSCSWATGFPEQVCWTWRRRWI